MTNYIITAGIVRRNNEILLVKHNSEFGSKDFWTVPGGTANENENALQSVTRELKEETGLVVKNWKSIAYIAQHLNYKRNWQSIVIVFESDNYEGNLTIADPDGDIIEVDFFPIEDAIELIKEIPFPVMRDPLIDYLSNEIKNILWIYNENNEGFVELTNKIS